MVFKPEIVAKLADCGITMLDAPAEVMAIGAQLSRPRPQLARSPDDLKKAEDLLMSIRPYMRYFNSSQYIDDLGNGEICLSIGYSGDVFIARPRRGGQGASKSTTSIPKEGAHRVVRPARHPGRRAASRQRAQIHQLHAWSREIAAANTNYVFYANGNKAALELIDDGGQGRPGDLSAGRRVAKLFPLKAHTPDYDER